MLCIVLTNVWLLIIILSSFFRSKINSNWNNLTNKQFFLNLTTKILRNNLKSNKTISELDFLLNYILSLLGFCLILLKFFVYAMFFFAVFNLFVSVKWLIKIVYYLRFGAIWRAFQLLQVLAEEQNKKRKKSCSFISIDKTMNEWVFIKLANKRWRHTLNNEHRL